MTTVLPVQLISTDFDGTLFAEHEDPPVPHALQDVIAGLQQQGARWVINTGRDLSGVLETLARARLKIHPDYVVVVEREIYRREAGHYVSEDTWNIRCHQLHDALFHRIRKDLPRLASIVESQQNAIVYRDAYSPFCVITETVEDMDAIYGHLEDYCRENPDIAVMRNDVYARFNHVEFNKGTALAHIGRLIGVPPERTFAAGDHWNDLEMLSKEVACCLTTPSNAIPEVKQAVAEQGGFVSTLPCGHGVADGLKYYLNRK